MARDCLLDPARTDWPEVINLLNHRRHEREKECVEQYDEGQSQRESWHNLDCAFGVI